MRGCEHGEQTKKHYAAGRLVGRVCASVKSRGANAFGMDRPMLPGEFAHGGMSNADPATASSSPTFYGGGGIIPVLALMFRKNGLVIMLPVWSWVNSKRLIVLIATAPVGPEKSK